MRTIILAAILTFISVAGTGASFNVPKLQRLSISKPLVIERLPIEELCKKYEELFMEYMHRSLECSEDYGTASYNYEVCEKVGRLLTEFSQLRSYYCYGEEIL